MKKLVLFAGVLVALSFASCNSAKQEAPATETQENVEAVATEGCQKAEDECCGKCENDSLCQKAEGECCGKCENDSLCNKAEGECAGKCEGEEGCKKAEGECAEKECCKKAEGEQA